MIQKFPVYEYSDLHDNPVEQVKVFDTILSKSESLGIVNTPPENESDSYKDPENNIRLRTVSSRLYLLGYLKKKIPTKKLDAKREELSQAVLQFQSDAGLKPDNWIGDQTWYLLDELVSFESSLSNHWFVGEGFLHTKALHRAIQLRLFSLGLASDKPEYRFEKIAPSGLNNFYSVLSIFMMYNVSKDMVLNKTIVNLLFDQDRLIQGIHKSSAPDKKSFRLLLGDKNKKSNLDLAQRFISANVKVELWLLGFDVEIDGKNHYLTQTNSKLNSAIKTYLIEIEGFTSKKSSQLSNEITPELIDSIARYSGVEIDTDVSEKLLDEFESSDSIERAWSASKKMGMRLWDGLNRVWRWFKKIGKKLFSFLEENIIKAFFRYVTKSYKIVKNGTQAIAKSIEVYLKGDLQVSGIGFDFSKDMDTRVFVPTNASDRALKDSMSSISKQSKSFNVACRILSWVVKIFRSLVEGYVGWARLLFTLLKSYKKLRLLYMDFKEVATV